MIAQKSQASWHEAKIVSVFKKGDPKVIKNYRPISLMSHNYKIFTRFLQSRTERTLDENQPREQAGFRKGYSPTDHLQALNQTIEKSNEYNVPLCIGFVDYEKVFDTVEHFAIFEALRKANINETYTNILQNIYSQATARIHLDKSVSDEFISTEESDKEIHSHLNYLLQLWRKSLRRQTSLKESMSMEKTSLT